MTRKFDDSKIDNDKSNPNLPIGLICAECGNLMDAGDTYYFYTDIIGADFEFCDPDCCEFYFLKQFNYEKEYKK